MVITPAQTDVLRELVNIGFGRAAAALSELTGRQVLLSVPSVAILPFRHLGPSLGPLIPGDVATVHQTFQGGFEGDALLILSREAAAALSDLMTEDHPRPNGLDDSDSEVLTEIGNILLHAFLGSFGNLMKARILMSVPAMRFETLESLLEGVLQQASASLALVVTTNFTVRDTTLAGYVVMLFEVVSLERMLHSLDGLG